MAYTEEELKWAKGLIQPDLPEYDAKDHEIAKLRFILNEITERLATLHFRSNRKYWRDETDHLTVDQVCQQIHDMLYTPEGDARMPDGTDQEEIDAFAKDHNWDYWKSEHLHGWHCGDCTAVAASCGKCHAETFYGMKTPYEGKSAGWKALHIFTEHRKQQEAAAGGPVNESTTGWASYDLFAESKAHLSTVDATDQEGSKS